MRNLKMVTVKGVVHQLQKFPIKVKNPFPRGGEFRVITVNYWNDEDTNDWAMIQRIRKVISRE